MVLKSGVRSAREESYKPIREFIDGMQTSGVDETSQIEALSQMLQAAAANRREGESIEDTWSRIGNYLENSLFSSSSALQDELVQQREEISRLQNENEELSNAGEEMESYASALVAQLDITRGGATPPCLYRAPSGDSSGVRGVSVPVALILIEDGQLTFQEIYTNIFDESLVDFWGRTVDTTELKTIMDRIEIQVPRDINGFRAEAMSIKALADVEDESHSKCLFTADYTMDDFVPLSMFTQVFQAYFLPQTRRSIGR